MNLLRLVTISAFIASSLAIYDASALTIDQGAGASSNGSALADPDEKIPFPHVADDGDDSSANLQSGVSGNNSVSFGFTSSGSNDNAFQRAQDRMQQ